MNHLSFNTPTNFLGTSKTFNASKEVGPAGLTRPSRTSSLHGHQLSQANQSSTSKATVKPPAPGPYIAAQLDGVYLNNGTTMCNATHPHERARLACPAPAGKHCGFEIMLIAHVKVLLQSRWEVERGFKGYFEMEYESDHDLTSETLEIAPHWVLMECEGADRSRSRREGRRSCRRWSRTWKDTRETGN
jgi:hypothetical protein